jgi:PAS domain S-box-containing protein
MSKKSLRRGTSKKNKAAYSNPETRTREQISELERAKRLLSKEIDERRRAEEAVKAEHKRFNDVLETLPVYLVLLTPDYHVPFANRFFRERFGESHGKRCFEYLFGRTEPCEICETYTVLKTMAPHHWEWTGPDGRNYDIYDFPFIDADGSKLILEMGIDITERKRFEQELRRHQEHLAEMIRERTAELESKNKQLSTEITERNRTEHALRRVTNEWERTFNSVPDMIAVLDDRHWIVRVNQTMAKRLGCTPEQCVGKLCYEVMHGTNAPPAFCPHVRTLADGLEHTVEIHEKHLGGDFLITTTPILDEEGHMIGSVHMARDITDLKKAEEHIRSVALFPEENPFPIMRTSVSGTLIYANRSAAELLEQWQCSIGALVPEMVRQKVSAAVESGRQQEMEIRCGMQDISFVLVPILERGYVNFYGRDITGIKKAETALRESGEDLNRAQAVAHTGSWRLDVRQDKLLWSDETYRIFGIPKGTPMTYEMFLATVHPEDRGYVDSRWTAALGGESYDIEHRILVDDKVKWVRERAELELDREGELTGGFGTVQDITEMKDMTMERIRLIEELQRSRDELEIRVQDRTAELQKSTKALEQSNRELENFAHVASHDLQEPLRKIRTFADRLLTIQQDSLDDKARDYLTRMHLAAGRMQALVQDLLTYSRVTSRRTPFKLINLRIPVDEAVTDLMVLFEETGGSIEIDELPEIEADQVQMRQLFQNLISNGLKYHGEERPVIRVYNSPSSQDEFHEIHVEDNGIGFDELHLDKIFMPFQRLHGKSAPYNGTGMGLAICRRILEHYGGSITAKSNPGKGATFIVRLPKKRGGGYGEEKE